MIRAEGLTVRYDTQPVLADVSFAIEAGDFVLVTGPSGCGKSTLAQCLNGLIPHSTPAVMSGRILIDGRDTAGSSVAELATRVGVVFQIPATQLFNLFVDEEVAFGPRNLELSETDVEARVAWALDAVGITALRGRRIQELSGGEQQRVAIASVLAMGARTLVLDEPTSSLDGRGTRDVLATLARLNRDSGVTIILIEHRLADAAPLARRAIILDQGRIVADGPTASVFAQSPLLRRLGLRRPVQREQSGWQAMLTPPAAPPGPPIVEVRGLNAGYKGQPVLQGLDMTLYEGEFAALVGDNGAGKSTLARVLAGLIKPAAGSVRLGNGRRLLPGRDVGLLFQNPLLQLFCDTVGEEVAFGPRNLAMGSANSIDEALAVTDLEPLRQRSILALSCGQQQRTALAAIISTRPRLIILDEPTIGQDWGHLSMFMDYLRRLNQSGATILLITHDHKLVYHYAMRILVLAGGRIVADGAPGRSAAA